MRGVQVLEAPLHLNTGADRILHAEAAEVGAHTGLHHAHALGVGLPGWHPQIRPYLRQVGLVDPKQINALAAGNLHHAHLIFIGNIGDAAQLFG